MKKLVIAALAAFVAAATVQSAENLESHVERYLRSLPYRVIYWTERGFFLDTSETAFRTTVENDGTALVYRLHVSDLYAFDPLKAESYRVPASRFFYIVPDHDLPVELLDPDGNVIHTNDNARLPAPGPEQIARIESEIQKFSELTRGYADLVFEQQSSIPLGVSVLTSIGSAAFSAFLLFGPGEPAKPLEAAAIVAMGIGSGAISVATAVVAILTPFRSRARKAKMQAILDEMLAATRVQESSAGRY